MIYFFHLGFLYNKIFLIKRCKIAAINFHPGPPQYRGIGCINYALFEKAKFMVAQLMKLLKKLIKGKLSMLKNSNSKTGRFR